MRTAILGPYRLPMLRGGRRVGGKKRKLAGMQLLPWGIGRKVVGVGKNYAAHAKELKSAAGRSLAPLLK